MVQVSVPGTVSQVLQRIGRSGHRLDAVSKGVMIPKTRGDLLVSSFASYQAKQYDIESVRVPQNCLDVLAQRYYIDNERKNSPWTKYNTYPSMGRWSRADNSDDSGVCGSIAGYINTLLDRYGIVAKEIVNKEKCGFSWTEVYTWLKNNELVSGIKRGFYVSGLSAIQFMRDRDIELIRMFDDSPDKNEYVALCSCDPANPYRDILSGAAGSRLTARPGNAMVFFGGRPVLYIREYGHMMQPLTDDTEVLKKAAGCFVDAYRNRMIWTGRKNIFTEYWSDMTGEKESRIEDSPIYADLQDHGYERGYSGMTLWKKAL